LVAVSHTDVQAWVTKLSESLAPSSVRKIHVVFSGLMKYAVHDRRIPAIRATASACPELARAVVDT
jgi:hypothetical protein